MKSQLQDIIEEETKSDIQKNEWLTKKEALSYFIVSAASSFLPAVWATLPPGDGSLQPTFPSNYFSLCWGLGIVAGSIAGFSVKSVFYDSS